MIHYTDALTGLVRDIVQRVDALSFIDTDRLLVFARYGRSPSAGAFATCHSLNLPPSEPGYYYWRDRGTRALTRRTECFVMQTPEVWMGSTRLDYLLSFTLPRFCDQRFDGSRKARWYRSASPWMAKLDTVVHELYHIDPKSSGLRIFERADGSSAGNHSPTFREEVAALVEAYLRTRPDPALRAFLDADFGELTRRHGAVAGTAFRNFPSYPRRHAVVVTPQPRLPRARLAPVARTRQPPRYTEEDLRVRLFTADGTRVLEKSRLDSAA